MRVVHTLFCFGNKITRRSVRLNVSIHNEIQLFILIFIFRIFCELRLQKVKSCVGNREDEFKKYLEIDPTVCFQNDLPKKSQTIQIIEDIH